MDFAFSDEQESLRETVRSFLRRHVGAGGVRAAVDEGHHHDPEVWRRMGSELGLHGIHLSEQLGGQGWGYLELAVVCEELGAALAPSPYFASTVLAGTLLAAAAPSGLDESIAEVGSGGSVATVAIAEPGHGWDLERIATEAAPSPSSDVVLLHGTKVAVPYGLVADLILVVAKDSVAGLVVALVESDAEGLSGAWAEGLDLIEPKASLTFSGTPARVVASGAAAEAALGRLHDLGNVMLACEMVGGARACLDGAVAYAGQRRQFERPIAAFQAIKHLCVDMLVEVELATAASHFAAWTLDGDDGLERTRTSSMAKVMASEAYLFVADAALHVYGGIGFTWEHDAHLHLRRARSRATVLGTLRSQREAFLRASGLGAGG